MGLPVCSLRQIPVYCSHHVEVDTYAQAYAHEPIASFGLMMYNMLLKSPCLRLATINSAPTLCFLKSHLQPTEHHEVRRIPSATHGIFSPVPLDKDVASERRDVRRQLFGVEDSNTK